MLTELKVITLLITVSIINVWQLIKHFSTLQRALVLGNLFCLVLDAHQLYKMPCFFLSYGVSYCTLSCESHNPKRFQCWHSCPHDSILPSFLKEYVGEAGESLVPRVSSCCLLTPYKHCNKYQKYHLLLYNESCQVIGNIKLWRKT